MLFAHVEEKKWLITFSFLFVINLFIEALFLLLKPMYKEFNNFLRDIIGPEINYVLILILLFCIPLIYSMFYLIGNLVWKKKNNNPIVTSLTQKIISIASIVILLSILTMLIVAFGDDAVLLVYILDYYSPFIFLFFAVFSIIFAYPLSSEVIRLIFSTPKNVTRKIKWNRVLTISITALIYILLFIFPLVFQPSYVIKGELKPKPKIISHRGGARYAPENTLMAARYTNRIEAAGWEIDVRISNDGIPFLMHDDTLERTTNIIDVFPERKDDLSSSFNMSELRQLNAGMWFVIEDPYKKIAEGRIPEDLLENYPNATIPSLREAIDYSETTGLIVNVDFYSPPETHPFYDQYFNICLSVLQTADNHSKIWVTSGETEWLDITKELYPEMITALSVGASNEPNLEEFLATGYDMINTPHVKPPNYFERFYEAEISVNAWTVNMASRFQQLWSAGVFSVTTDEPIVYLELDDPVLLISRKTYLSVWIVGYILGLLAVLSIRRIKRGSFL